MKPFIFLIAGLIIGCSVSGLLNEDQKKTVPATNVLTATVKSNSDNNERYFNAIVDSLQQANVTLVHKVGTAKTELQKVKADNQVLVGIVDTLIAHAASTTDTLQKLADCDSMGGVVQELIISSAQKDSLYEQITATLQTQVTTKDAIINTSEQKYGGLKLSFDQSLVQQDMLFNQNNLLVKQLKGSRTKNKVLSAIVVVLAGVGASLTLLHH